MPHNVEVGIFFIGKTQVDRHEVENWMSYIGADKYDPNFDEKTSAELITELAGRRCYMSFQTGLNPNVTKIREDIVEYIDNILKSAHGSVFEHCVYNFAIEGVSRVFTGELNRHRAGTAISEGSMRYIRYEDMGWWMPPSLRVIPTDSEELKAKKLTTQQLFHSAFAESERHYKLIQDVWKDELAPESKFHGKKQVTSMMRRIIPMGIATGGVWSFNLRALRHILTMRTSSASEEEICYVFSNIMKRIRDLEPTIFGDFTQDDYGFWSPLYKKV